jgi:peptidoglycan/LPS O-acetylase OafA/YrhL
MRFLGNISYHWYLWQWPFMVFAPLIAGRTFSWARNLEISFLALWTAGLSYLLLESALRGKYAERIHGLRRGLVLSGAVVMITLLVVTSLDLPW